MLKNIRQIINFQKFLNPPLALGCRRLEDNTLFSLDMAQSHTCLLCAISNLHFSELGVLHT